MRQHTGEISPDSSRHVPTSRHPFALSAALSLAVVACSAGSSGPSEPAGSNLGSGASSAAGAGGGGGSGAMTFIGDGGSGFVVGDTGGQTSGGAGGTGGIEECASTSQAAEEIVVEVPVEIVTREPVALFIMMDRSGSMVTGFPPPASPDSWNVATAAVTGFVNDPQSEGIDVGLGTFPVGEFNTASCDGADCGQAVVPIGRLPGNAQNMVTAMQTQGPSSDIALTPTECALNGMINHCIGFMQNSPDGEQCVAILVTDGTPTQCDVDHANLVNIVANGFANGVLTYTLGLPGADLNFLNALAQAGGTNMSIDVTTGAQTFIDSLNAIRDSVTTVEVRTEVQSTQLDCSWTIPDPPEGESFDESKVNVEFEATGVARQPFGNVPDEASCAQYQGGWYYDDSVGDGSSRSISVCPQTCDLIKASQGARVDILLGCETIPASIR